MLLPDRTLGPLLLPGIPWIPGPEFGAVAAPPDPEVVCPEADRTPAVSRAAMAMISLFMPVSVISRFRAGRPSSIRLPCDEVRNRFHVPCALAFGQVEARFFG